MSLSPATYACLAPKETKLLTFLSFIIRTHPGRNSPLGPKEIKLYTFSTAIIICTFAVVIEQRDDKIEGKLKALIGMGF